MSSDDTVEFPELAEVWKRSARACADGVDGAEAAAQVIARVRVLEAHARRRDRIETGVAIVMLPFFAWLVIAAPSTVSRIGAALICLGCVLTIFRLRQARRREPDAGLTLADSLRAELRWTEAQDRLLRSAAWWYIAPLCGGATLFVVGGNAPTSFRVGYAIVTSAFAGLLFFLNRRAARQEFAPRSAELRASLEALVDPARDDE